jgi:ABC-type nitrate/sulfonate/bicarbonate transport system substrate-binding protein
MDTKTARIRALNDQLRQNFAEGIAVMTPGVAALGPEAVERIVKTIAVFDDFCHANDPHEEHDFGSFEADGHRIYFKIDYFDRELSMHSPDPADPSITQRVITIMLAEEY